MATKEAAKGWEEMAEGERELAVAEKVMGWTVYRGEEPRESEAVFPHVLFYKGKVLLCRSGPPVSYKRWHPLADPAAADSLRRHVLATWGSDAQDRFIGWLLRLAARRRDVHNETPGVTFLSNCDRWVLLEPEDWAKAAYLALSPSP